MIFIVSLFSLIFRCPGICPALGDCHSCLINGIIRQTGVTTVSVSQKLRLGECTWCVQNARCHHKDDTYGICGLREDSPSMSPGWWGSKGTEVLEPKKCRELDQRPGLTFVKYYHPVNLSQPDHVAIINATTVSCLVLLLGCLKVILLWRTLVLH